MSDFTRLMLLADKLAAHYLAGTMAATVLSNWLVDHGFYGVRIGGDVIAWRDNIRFDLGNS